MLLHEYYFGNMKKDGSVAAIRWQAQQFEAQAGIVATIIAASKGPIPRIA